MTMGVTFAHGRPVNAYLVDGAKRLPPMKRQWRFALPGYYMKKWWGCGIKPTSQ